MLNIATAIAKGRMIRKSEMPAAFMAVNSNFSAKLPKEIRELSNIAKGRARGTTDAVAYIKNSDKTLNSIPFPTKSFTCIHINCINRINIAIKNVAKNNPKKFRSK